MSDDKPPEITPEVAKQLADEGARLSKVIIDFVPVFNHECATTSAAKARQG